MKESVNTICTPKIEYVRDFIHKTVHGGRVVALNRNFVSSSFNQRVNVLRNYFGEEHEILTLVEIYFRKIDKVKKHYTKKYESEFDDYRVINEKNFEEIIKKLLSKLPISKELNTVDKRDLLVSGVYNSLYPSAMVHEKSTWPKVETAKAINIDDSDLLCELLNSGE